MLERPIFIVAPPRSGASLLFRTLAQSPSVGTLTGGLDAVIESIDGLQSHRLTADQATPAVVAALGPGIAGQLHDRDANSTSGTLRLLAASPRSALRVPFLRAAFPGARFAFVYRDPRESLSSMITAAESETTVEIVARQWMSAASILLDDLERLPPEEWCVVNSHRLFSDPKEEIGRLCRFLEIDWDRPIESIRLKPDIATDRHQADLDSIAAIVEPVAERVRDLFARPPRERPRNGKEQAAAAADPSPFSSVSTQSFPAILHQLGISLLVTTYQSGRVIAIRAENATTLNTHLRSFRSPMGLAVGNGRIALGTEREVWDYRNQPAVAAKVDPPGRHDACFVPRNVHYTGDIRIHEIGYAGGELWIVNTRFSTLCTLDADSSFVPRWRPKFVTHLAAEDRCHLNGMAIIDDRVKYVTALGITNVAGGWRENKTRGGVLIDVDSDEIVLSGLSMPHSPRRHGDRFWILESGKGTLAAADLDSGRVETIAELPGFTRGLAFAGPFAFIGLSQVRESNIFGGIPLVDRVQERKCGVWVVDLRTGQVVAFLSFEGSVQEIFDVQVLPGIRYPEILEPTADLVAVTYALPDAALNDVAR